MIDREGLFLNVRNQDEIRKDQRQIPENGVMRNTDTIDQYSKQLEILNQAGVMINSSREMPSILRITTLAALELWESDGGTAGIIKDGELIFKDLYWRGRHYTGEFKCDILNELRSMTYFMGILGCDNGQRRYNRCFPDVLEGEIKEQLAIPIYDRQLNIQACLLLFNPDRSFFNRNLIDNPLPGLISSMAIALDNTRNLTELRKKEEALQASLHEKELLLKEIHHRVKNNLQAIVGLLEAHLGMIQNNEDRQVFLKGQSLAMSISMIHELLYSSEDYAKVDFSQYTSQLAQNLLDLYPGVRDRISVNIELDGIHLNADTAVPVSLIINELLSNALTHAFPDERAGNIIISMKYAENGSLILRFTDDGIGMTSSDRDSDRQALGLHLVQSLIENLRGTMETKINGGTSITMRFKEYHECEDLELG